MKGEPPCSQQNVVVTRRRGYRLFCGISPSKRVSIVTLVEPKRYCLRPLPVPADKAVLYNPKKSGLHT